MSLIHNPTPALQKVEEGTSVDKQPFDRGSSPDFQPRTDSKTEISDKKDLDLGEKN